MFSSAADLGGKFLPLPLCHNSSLDCSCRIACEGGSAIRLGHLLMTCETSGFKLLNVYKLLYCYG